MKRFWAAAAILSSLCAGLVLPQASTVADSLLAFRVVAPQIAADSAPADGQLPPASLEWQPCQRKFECATLTVPLDYSGNTPGHVSFGLLRWPAADPDHRIGTLLIDPGGPGGSGTDFLRSSSVQSWTLLHRSFDIVGFDPRGVGPAGEAVDCVDDLDDYFRVAIPHDAASEDALHAIARSLAAGCEQRSGRLLPFLSAESVARDMEQIRLALGEERISYLGFSYGTYLGAMYADLFPTHVRAFVLDGAVDPALPARDWQLQQAIGFETAFDAFSAACMASPGCPLSRFPGGPASAYDSLIASLRQHPLRDGGRALGPGEAEIGVLAALYSRSAWPYLADAIAAAGGGDGSGLLNLFDGYVGRGDDGSYDNSQEIYRAISCVDLAFPRDVAEYDRWAVDFEQQAPRFGRGAAFEHIDCASWAAPPAPARALTGVGAPPILVIGTTRDPATPLSWAVALAAELRSGVLLKVDGDGHTAYGKNACATALTNLYLVTLLPPGSGASCPSDVR